MESNHTTSLRRRLFTIVCLAGLLPTLAFADVLVGKVVGVSDGDTITVLDVQREQHKIRVAGIDAPEKAQAFGARSKEHLSATIYGRDVEVDWTKRGPVPANCRQGQSGIAGLPGCELREDTSPNACRIDVNQRRLAPVNCSSLIACEAVAT